MRKHFVLLIVVLHILLPLPLRSQPIGPLDQNRAFNTSTYFEELEKLADKWQTDQDFFLDSPAYKPFISDNVLIHGMKSSPNFRYGNTTTYYNYSDPTILFLPPDHKGGILSLNVFFHGDRVVPEVNIYLDDKSYTLKPQRATDEYIYNSYLQKRPVWNSGLALTIVVPSAKRYVELRAENPELLIARVTFIEDVAPKASLLQSGLEEPAAQTAEKPVQTPAGTTKKAQAGPNPSPESKTSSAPKVATTEPVVPPSLQKEKSEEWSRFTSNLEKFALDYPANWTLDTNIGQLILELIPPLGSKKIVVTKDSIGTQSLAEFAYQVGNIIGMQRISQTTQQAEGRLRQTARVILGDVIFYLDVLYVRQGSFVFTITAISPEESKDDYLEEVDAILSSFSLL
ncbi:MAG: hypothetical protein PHD88_04020 [Firmicutes bacterium]|nr:hypothetical protein [Bacillota bacterium]MDD4693558.1 hypothetical protein [Bacillota bacterium]